MANYKTIMVIVGDWCDYGLINYITKEVVPPASGPGASGYHGVSQRGRGTHKPLVRGCWAHRCVSGGDGAPASPLAGVCVGPLVRLRGECGPASLVCVSEGNVDPQAFRIK